MKSRRRTSRTREGRQQCAVVPLERVPKLSGYAGVCGRGKGKSTGGMTGCR